MADHHVLTCWECFVSRLKAAHLPVLGHRFAPNYIKIRPKLYCYRCHHSAKWYRVL